MLTEAIIGGIVEAMLGYALEHAEVTERVRDWLRGEPAKRALQAALRVALTPFVERYPSAPANLFDASFFQHEGARVLAELLWRHGGPTASDLVTAWADSLNLRDDHRDRGVQEMMPVAEEFLSLLESEAKKQPDLQEVFDRRSREQTAVNTAQTAASTAQANLQLKAVVEQLKESNTLLREMADRKQEGLSPDARRAADAEDTRVIDRGVAQLATLVSVPDAGPVLAAFRASFQDMSLHFDRLSDYKDLHDQLLELQLLGYQVIKAHSPRFPDNEETYKTVRDTEPRLALIIAQIQRLATRPNLSSAIYWMPTLTEAASLLEKAITERDGSALLMFCEIVRGILAVEPGYTSHALSDAAKSLMIDTGHPLLAVLTSLQNWPLPSTTRESIESSVVELVDRIQRINSLATEHGNWQKEAGFLQMLEKTSTNDLTFIQRQLCKVRERLAPLINGRDELWTYEFGRLFAKLDGTFERRETSDTLVHLEEFRRITDRKFYEVDKTLKDFCVQLRANGTSYAALVRVIEVEYPSIGASAADVFKAPSTGSAPIQRKHLGSIYKDLGMEYDRLTLRIQALDKDISQSRDSEVKLQLTWRRETLEAEREKTVNQIRRIEALLGASGPGAE